MSNNCAQESHKSVGELLELHDQVLTVNSELLDLEGFDTEAAAALREQLLKISRTVSLIAKRRLKSGKQEADRIQQLVSCDALMN